MPVLGPSSFTGLAAAQVIDAVASRLAPVPMTGGRIYTSRFWPLTEADLPAGRVFAADEQIQMETVSNTEHHTLNIDAKGYVHATADADDAMNNLASAWLTALFANPPNNLVATGITRDVDGTHEAAVGVVTLHLQATFFTQQSDPETIL